MIGLARRRLPPALGGEVALSAPEVAEATGEAGVTGAGAGAAGGAEPVSAEAVGGAVFLAESAVGVAVSDGVAIGTGAGAGAVASPPDAAVEPVAVPAVAVAAVVVVAPGLTRGLGGGGLVPVSVSTQPISVPTRGYFESKRSNQSSKVCRSYDPKSAKLVSNSFVSIFASARADSRPANGAYPAPGP